MIEELQDLIEWHPSSDADRQAVLGQLERMLESPLFRNSRRYPNLLRYLVEQTLAGNDALLKERNLGITVFQRPHNYDTNLDTVVRLAASEVRKRIAQYYHQPEHSGQLQIDLRPGSYVPLFRRPAAEQPMSHPPAFNPLGSASSRDDQGSREDNPNGLQLVQDPVADSTTKKAQPGVAVSSDFALIPPAHTPAQGTASRVGFLRRHTALLVASVLLALLVLGAGALFLRQAHQAALTSNRQLWAPILSEPGQAQIVIADLSASLSQAQRNATTPDGGLMGILRMGELVNYRDSMALSGIVAFLARQNKPYALELSSQASYPDLQRGASVLVGGLDNVWTMRVTDRLRYHFVQRGQSLVFAIEDRQHPELAGWNVDMGHPYDRVSEDFAIVARIFDQTTGRPVLVVAGLGANGTDAAAHFLLDPDRTAELAAHAPPDWRHMNMEAVIRTQILDNHAGPPHLVACYFW